MRPVKSYIAKRFQNSDAGLSLDTDALARYSDIIDLSIGDTDFITDDAIIDTAFREAKAGYTHYGDPKGDPELIRSVCDAWQTDFKQPLSPDHVLVTASSSMGMALVMLSVLDPGDEVIVFSPYFSLYRTQAELAGGVCVEVPTYASEGWAIDEARLRAAITPRTKLIVFNNPCNPTGMGYDRSTLELLGRVAEEHDLLIAADEIYTTYLYEGDFRPIRTLPGMAERTIVVNGFSKTYAMTGWRLGYACGPAPIIKIMTKIHQSAIMSAPTTSQYAAITALKECDGEIDRMRDEYNMRRRLVVRSFNDMGLTCFEPRGAFYAFPCIKSTGMSSQEFCTKLLEQKHVAIIPGDAFGASGEGYCRVSYAYSVEHLTEALKRIREFLQENHLYNGN